MTALRVCCCKSGEQSASMGTCNSRAATAGLSFGSRGRGSISNEAEVRPSQIGILRVWPRLQSFGCEAQAAECCEEPVRLSTQAWKRRHLLRLSSMATARLQSCLPLKGRIPTFDCIACFRCQDSKTELSFAVKPLRTVVAI